MKRALVAAALVACGNRTPKKPVVADPNGGITETDAERRAGLRDELQDEILGSYERDELPDVETTMIPPQVGPARINVGPGDVLFADAVRRMAWSRWPLQLVPGTPTNVRSKRLEIHLSNEKHVSAAWMSDELSWRITLCNRTAVIPLRMTALYAHDGDRWVQVFEHMSFGRRPEPSPDGNLRGAPLLNPGEVCPARGAADRCPIFDHPRRDVSDELSRVLQALLSGLPDRMSGVVATAPLSDDPSVPAPTVLLGPAAEAEWHGDQSLDKIQLVDGKVKLEDRRIGVITSREGSVKNATVAYWVGNLTADLRDPPGRVRLRGTFVFEKRKDKWVVVQGHISEPIDDYDLALRIWGTALIAEKPLQITCDDGRRSVTPATVQSSPEPAAPPAPEGSRTTSPSRAGR